MKIDANLPSGLENESVRQTEFVAVPKVKTAEETPVKSFPPQDLKQVVEAANGMLKMVDTRCEFEIDEGTNIQIIKVVNKESGEVIKQYPPEEIVNLVNRIYDMLGVIVDKKV